MASYSNNNDGWGGGGSWGPAGANAETISDNIMTQHDTDGATDGKQYG